MQPDFLDHEARDDAIVICSLDLEKSAKYSSKVEEIEVRDPVNGHPVINTKVPFQYEFPGKTVLLRQP